MFVLSECDSENLNDGLGREGEVVSDVAVACGALGHEGEVAVVDLEFGETCSQSYLAEERLERLGEQNGAA